MLGVWVCVCAVIGGSKGGGGWLQVLLLAWTVDVSFVLYLVRVGNCFSGMCAPQN